MSNSLDDLLQDLNVAEILSHIEFDKSIQLNLKNFLDTIKREIKNEVQKIKNTGWISVDDRLPEEEGRYLCVSKYLDKLYTEICNFTKDAYELDEYDFAEYKGKKKALFYDYDSEFCHIERSRVIAWIPLPEYNVAEADRKVGGAE